ncbi:MAG: bifunctional nuclease family protein [Armatimonadota bacterium]
MLLDEEQHFVRLTGADRMLSIVIGPFEAQAILLPLQEVKSDRPMTHDLLQTMIERLGARVVSVLIDDLWNDFYYAKIQLKQGKERFEVDSRPSDALALAVRFDVPIFVTERVFEIADQKLED